MANAEYTPLLDDSQSEPEEDNDLNAIQIIPSGSTHYGTLPASQSCSNVVGAHPYTNSTKPNRRPFHVPRPRHEPLAHNTELYARFKYYSRLRAPVGASEHALVMPDHIVPVNLFIPFIPGHVQTSDGKQDSIITIIAIWNTMMGTSLLSMPWAFGQAGFVGGLLIMFTMLGICLYTAYRMLTIQKTMGMEGDMHEIAFLCRCLWKGSFGKAVEGLAVTFSVITLVGAMMVYWVLMSNFLFNTGESIHGAIYSVNKTIGSDGSLAEVLCPPNNTNPQPHLPPNSTLLDDIETKSTFDKWWQLELTVPLYLLFPFGFLLSIKNTKIFTYFNSLGAISVFVMYGFVVFEAYKWGFNFSLTDVTSVPYVPLFKTSFMALTGTLSLAYFIHNCVITILKGNRKPENNVRDLTVAYVLVSCTYIPIAVIFYLTFPLPKFCIVDNFLDNFPPHNTVLAIVRGFLLFQMCTVYPLLALFVRTQVLSYLMGANLEPTWPQIILLNIVLLTFCVLIAIFYPSIGFIIRWVGAISGLAYIFVIPCCMYLQALRLKGELTYKIMIPHLILIIIGVSNFIAQFFIN